MSRSHPQRVTVLNKLKGFLTKSHPSDLAQIRDTVIHASSVYPSLQEAAAGLFKGLKKIEVGPFFYQSRSISEPLIFPTQKAAQHGGHISELKISFSGLATKLQDLQEGAEAFPPSFDQHINSLTR